MKLTLPEKPPEALVVGLAALGHDADHVRLENLAGESDPPYWQAARHAGRHLITQELDSSYPRRFALGTHRELRQVRLRSRDDPRARRIRQAFASEAVENWKRCFVRLTDLRVRVPRPARKAGRTWTRREIISRTFVLVFALERGAKAAD